MKCDFLLFAGITLLDRKALLLRAKVGGQGVNLRTWCYASLSHSSPHPSHSSIRMCIGLLQELTPRCSTILGSTTGAATTSAPGHRRNNKGVSKVSVGGAIPRLMSYCSPFTASLPTLSTAAKTKRARTSESQNNGQKRWT